MQRYLTTLYANKLPWELLGVSAITNPGFQKMFKRFKREPKPTKPDAVVDSMSSGDLAQPETSKYHN